MRSLKPVWKLSTPLPAHLHPKSLRLPTSATSQEAATPLDPHVTTRVHHLRFTARLRLTTSQPPEPPQIPPCPPLPLSGSLSHCTRPANLAAPTTTPGAPNDPSQGARSPRPTQQEPKDLQFWLLQPLFPRQPQFSQQ